MPREVIYKHHQHHVVKQDFAYLIDPPMVKWPKVDGFYFRARTIEVQRKSIDNTGVVILSGPQILRNGNDSKSERRTWTYPFSDRDNWPAWLGPLVDRLTEAT